MVKRPTSPASGLWRFSAAMGSCACVDASGASGPRPVVRLAPRDPVRPQVCLLPALQAGARWRARPPRLVATGHRWLGPAEAPRPSRSGPAGRGGSQASRRAAPHATSGRGRGPVGAGSRAVRRAAWPSARSPMRPRGVTGHRHPSGRGRRPHAWARPDREASHRR
jgi:hypothetical protein